MRWTVSAHKIATTTMNYWEPQPIEPSICSSLSSTVQRMSASEPIEEDAECPLRAWSGMILKEPASIPRERFSMRRPIWAELLKKTCNMLWASCRTLLLEGLPLSPDVMDLSPSSATERRKCFLSMISARAPWRRVWHCHFVNPSRNIPKWN